MDKKDRDDLGWALILYVFRKPFIIIGLILLVLFIAGYYKFAVPVYEEHEEKMSSFDFSNTWLVDNTTGDIKTYDEINPMRKEIARCLDDNGHVIEEKKERLKELSDELIVKYLGKTYKIEKKVEDGNIYYSYYIGTTEMESMHFAAIYMDLLIKEKYEENIK